MHQLLIATFLSLLIPSAALAADATNIWRAVAAVEVQRDALSIDKLEKITGHKLVLDTTPVMYPTERVDYRSAKSSAHPNEFVMVEWRTNKSLDAVDLVFLWVDNQKVCIDAAEVQKRFGKPKWTQPTPRGILSRFERPWGAIQVGYAPKKGPVDVISFEFRKKKRATKPSRTDP